MNDRLHDFKYAGIETPCEKFECIYQHDCAKQLLACAAFSRLIESGKLIPPNTKWYRAKRKLIPIPQPERSHWRYKRIYSGVDSPLPQNERKKWPRKTVAQSQQPQR